MKTKDLKNKKQSTFTNHKHTWIVSSVAIILAVVLIVLLPKNKSYSMALFGLAGSHLVIALIAIFTGWIVVPEKFLRKIWKKKATDDYDFGWSSKWLNGFLVASILVFIIAIYVYFSLNGNPLLQLISFTLLLLLAVNLFIGNVILRNSKRLVDFTLPMVQLLPNKQGKILDAGCGAGRTTIALGKALPEANITSFDRFDADYIEDSGKSLIERNIKIAGISERVCIVKGDITETPFNNELFDAIVSSYMFDHLGDKKMNALKELFRILKPGGRVLLIIAVRGYATFGIANILSLLFPTRKTWKKWIQENGFTMISEGTINEGAYFCFEKK
jgi:SAM-dependent methyltransferase